MSEIKVTTFLFALIFSLFGCTQSDDYTEPTVEQSVETENTPEEKETEGDSSIDEEPNNSLSKNIVSFYGIGDNLIHDTIIWDAETEDGTYDFSPIYENLAENIDAADIAYINQETIIGGDHLGFSGYPSFNTPSDMIPSLIDAGFNMVTGSNNHSLDMGTSGVYNTIEYWNEYEEEILFTGIFESQEHRDTIPVFETNDMTFSVLSYTYGTNGNIPEEPYFVNYFDANLIRDDVTRAKEVSDFVIVVVHWGDEYSYIPNQMQLDYAQLFADLGVMWCSVPTLILSNQSNGSLERMEIKH